LTSSHYSRGESDISVTQLIGPAYQRKLAVENEGIQDVSQLLPAFIGTAVHEKLERSYGPESIAEERLFMKVNGWTISGQFDLLEKRRLWDHKVTSIWTYILGGKIEWERQLNLLRLLALQKFIETGDDRYKVESLAVNAVFRDFAKPKAKSPDYPPAPAAVVEVPVWDIDHATEYLFERVKAHQDPNPPPCTDEERWSTGTVYALKKFGRKSALKLYDHKFEAEAALKDKDSSHFVEFRPPTYKRCEDFCPVSHCCPTFSETTKDLF
jgi:hypothetical protein